MSWPANPWYPLYLPRPEWCPPFVPGQKVVLESLASELLMQIIIHCGLPRAGTAALQNLSLASKLLRAVCIPRLFRVLTVRCDEHLLHTALAQVAASTHILPVVRAISFRPFKVHETLFSEKSFSCHETFPVIMLQLLNAMPNLVKARFDYHLGNSSYLPLLKAYIQNHQISVPGIKSIRIDTPTSVAFMLTDLFPNLTTVNIRVGEETSGLGALRYLTHLKALSLHSDGTRSHIGWCVEDIEHLVELAPNVQYLVLDGQLNDTPVSSLVKPFAKFSKLESLSIPCHQIIYTDPDASGDDSELAEEFYELKTTHPLNEDNELNATSLFIACRKLRHVKFYAYGGESYPFVPGVNDEDQIIALDVHEMHALWNDEEISYDYWDGQIPAAF